MFAGTMSVVCGSYAEMTAPLRASGEYLESAGPVDGIAARFEIWTRAASPGNPATWSAVLHYDNGQACIIGLGTDWRAGVPL